MDTISLLAEIEILKERLAHSVEVVRCGECKWWKPVVYSNGEGGRVCVQTPIEPATKPDDFCSYGERKTDDR